ncbi:MAG: DUF1385 domain-containing protein [Defluviitaleaceae bacterium]|nr:DUF1385 domain-containing protein [Defluviitaleaceae bacterium]
MSNNTERIQDQPHFYGGQAVMEGVMMRGLTMYSMAVRKSNGEIATVTHPIADPSKKYSILKWPVIRGMAAFVSALTVGMKTLTESAEIATEGEAEEPSSRFERFLLDKFGDKINDVIMQLSVVLAIAIAILLFILLPIWIGSGLAFLTDGHHFLRGLVEGLVRPLIFVVYIWIISRSKDIQRVFQYHGAEHMTINGFEQGAELTIDSVRGYSRLHNRCGTSFLLVVMFVSVIMSIFVQTPDPILRIASRLILLPVIAGISFEVIRWAGRSQSMWVKVISFPGLCLQRLTTKEPDEQQIEIAIKALETVLRAERPDDFPEELSEEIIEGLQDDD